MANEVYLGNIPDSDVLPNPSGEMYEFYEGLDTNLFSESTGMNHNAATKWLKSNLLLHLQFLSYLLSVKNGQTIMSNDIVHKDAIINDSVDLNKLHPDLRTLLSQLRTVNVIERNSVQTPNCITVANGKIRITDGTLISQANGFDIQGQFDLMETLTTIDLVQTTGNSTTGYLYKQIGGGYTQYTSKQNILNLTTMVGTKVYLGSFTVDGTGAVTSVTPAVPTVFTRAIQEPNFTGDYIKLPNGTTANRPSNPLSGFIRFNDDTNDYEGYKLGRWDTLGGGQMLGTSQVKAIAYSAQTINENIVIGPNLNAHSVGDITIADGCSITIGNNSVFKIL